MQGIWNSWEIGGVLTCLFSVRHNWRFGILMADIFRQAQTRVSFLFQDWIDLNLIIWQVYSDNIVYTRMDEWRKRVSTHSLNSQQIVIVVASPVLLSTVFDVNSVLRVNTHLIDREKMIKNCQRASVYHFGSCMFFQDKSNNYRQYDMSVDKMFATLVCWTPCQNYLHSNAGRGAGLKQEIHFNVCLWTF